MFLKNFRKSDAENLTKLLQTGQNSGRVAESADLARQKRELAECCKRNPKLFS
jgi:hypothetical protein